MFLQFIRLISQSSNDSHVVMTSINLYKYLLRQCERLPPDACKHYKYAVKQVQNETFAGTYLPTSF